MSLKRCLIAIPASTILALFSVITPAQAAVIQNWGLYQVNNTIQNDALGSNTASYAIQYYNWNYGLDTTDLQAAVNKNIMPLIELQPCTTTTVNCDTPVSATDIINGVYDSYLTNTVGAQIASLHAPVLITFGHEMNGSWYPWGKGGSGGWTPTQWIKAWHHVMSKIRSAAPLIDSVWAPNREDCTSNTCGTGVAGFDQYWPGNVYPTDQQVDFVGLDAYYFNTGDTWASVIAPSLSDEKTLTSGDSSIGGWMLTETGVNKNNGGYLGQIDDLVNHYNAVSFHGVGALGLFYFDRTTPVSEFTFTSAGQTEFCSDWGLPAC